jgi:predicted Zn-dependent protease with MMP-like domain
MNRADFVNAAEEALDSLPEEFRSRIKNVAILIEDFPPNQLPPQPGQQRRLLLGIFHGVPATRKSVFDVRWVLPTSCFIKRISKRFVRASQKSVNKSAKRLCMNWVTTSA